MWTSRRLRSTVAATDSGVLEALEDHSLLTHLAAWPNSGADLSSLVREASLLALKDALREHPDLADPEVGTPSTHLGIIIIITTATTTTKKRRLEAYFLFLSPALPQHPALSVKGEHLDRALSKIVPSVSGQVGSLWSLSLVSLWSLSGLSLVSLWSLSLMIVARACCY